MEGNHYNNCSTSEHDLVEQPIAMSAGDVVANHNETNTNRPVPFSATGRLNGYDLYPALPWGYNNKFTYDKWGQLSAKVTFEKADLLEYLYNHPLKKSLIIWIQRHPSKAHLLYQTHYGVACRYRGCQPKKGSPHAIAIGHYRIAIDELTGRHSGHKADTYIHAAFFHISCFEDMLDLAQVTRDFTVRCENRPVVNSPHGAEQSMAKNRMLLEDRIPRHVNKWLERARGDINWATTSVEDGMNYLMFTRKFQLRPHRRKCTEVPGMEKLGKDISHLGDPRPVTANPIWGGKRVKGKTVAELATMEGREYHGPTKDKNPAKSNKRARIEEGGDTALPARRPRVGSPVVGDIDRTVLESSRVRGPEMLQRPGDHQHEPYQRQAFINWSPRNARPEGPIQAILTQPTILSSTNQEPVAPSERQRGRQLPEPTQVPAATTAQQRESQLPGNTPKTFTLPPGVIIRTSGGEYRCNPVTGMLEPILSVPVIAPYQHGYTSPGLVAPQTPVQITEPVLNPIPQARYVPIMPKIQTPLINPVRWAQAAESRANYILPGGRKQ